MPEHFNVPWQDLITRRASEAGRSRPLEWREFPGGTGAMIEAISNGAIDIALLLTEGAVAGQARGEKFEIVSTYVTSPLIWGVHVPPACQYTSLDAIAGARFAISRFGSGSHLMAIALANERGWRLADSQFVVVGSLGGAIEAFAEGRADVFLWERFMTQPVVDRGDFRRIGDFVAPWAAFVVCVREALWADSRAEVEALIREVADQANRFAADPDTPARLGALFGLDPEQVRQWLGRTTWAAGLESPTESVKAARAVLEQAGVIAG